MTTRTEYIERLREGSGIWSASALDLATADMLEADEKALTRLRKMCNPEMSHQETLMVKIIDEVL